jgi:hypothetical protein
LRVDASPWGETCENVSANHSKVFVVGRSRQFVSRVAAV